MIAARARALGATVLLGLTLTGCAGRGETPQAIPPAELQSSLAGKLAAAGRPPTSVTCPRALEVTVGSTARCEVAFGDTDSVTALLTTLGPENGMTNYEITRAELTREQLAKRVAAAASAQKATCESGLDGQVDAWARCDLNRDGVAIQQLVEVRSVKGLVIDLGMTQVMPKAQVESVFAARLAAELGRPPDRVNCPGDLLGQSATTMQCLVVMDGKPDAYVLTVTGMGPGAVEFTYATKSSITGEKPGIDRCHGCPG